jgi:hypothetical protein
MGCKLFLSSGLAVEREIQGSLWTDALIASILIRLPAIRDTTNWMLPQNWTPLRLGDHMRGMRAAFDLPIRGNAAGRPRSLAPRASAK